MHELREAAARGEERKLVAAVDRRASLAIDGAVPREQTDGRARPGDQPGTIDEPLDRGRRVAAVELVEERVVKLCRRPELREQLDLFLRRIVHGRPGRAGAVVGIRSEEEDIARALVQCDGALRVEPHAPRRGAVGCGADDAVSCDAERIRDSQSVRRVDGRSGHGEGRRLPWLSRPHLDVQRDLHAIKERIRLQRGEMRDLSSE